jgi:hypothetical protein
LREVAAGMRSNKTTSARYSPRSDGNIGGLLYMMQKDPRIIDVRWMAYMLATAFWEGAVAVKVNVPNGKGGLKTKTMWDSVTTKEETGGGKGRIYGGAVKVHNNGRGFITVTEQDGEQATISGNGPPQFNGTLGVPIAKPQKPISDIYKNAPGKELFYYGRGYVQLTWWWSYSTIGVAIGMGQQLLLNPNLAKDRLDIAYKVMAHGMLTGVAFANQNKFSDFFNGHTTNYAGARRMVNSKEPLLIIVEAAKIFEAALIAARI